MNNKELYNFLVSPAERNQIGPSFTIEPKEKVQFYNSTGAVITCAANGVPLPTVTWVRQDGSTVQEVPELLQIRHDASLVLHLSGLRIFDKIFIQQLTDVQHQIPLGL